MDHRSAVAAGIAGVLAAVLAGTSCAGDDREAIRAAMQREAVTDWRIFNSADANGDGLSDLFWSSPSANLLSVWLMNGAHVLAPGRPIPGPPGEGWTAVNAGDFNRDGMSDVVWTNAARGTMAVWLLNGAELLAPGPEIAGPGRGWAVVNSGDTNGDGMADAIWYDASANRFSVWLMNGVHVLAPGPEIPGPPGEGWVVTNLADANGDGLADIYWTNPTTNQMSVWLLNGAHVLAPGPVIPGPGAGWTGVTSADFNRDGLNDLIWTNADRGAMAVWLLNGAHVLAPGPAIPGPSGEGWAIAYAGDTNGDGMADAIWQKSGTSQFAVWLMNGAQLLAPGAVISGPGEAASARR
jgi:hypothetical protein